MKLYIAVLDEFPDQMTPTLVAHSMLGAHLLFEAEPVYQHWLKHSFRKCTVRVNQKEFDKISSLPNVYLGHENKTLEGRKSCAVVLPMDDKDNPNVLKFAKLWKPEFTKESITEAIESWIDTCNMNSDDQIITDKAIENILNYHETGKN